MNKQERRLCLLALRRGYIEKTDVMPVLFEHDARDYYSRRQKVQRCRAILLDLEANGYLEETEHGRFLPTAKLQKEMGAAP